ncbi:MAG TPA: efflux RND transporter periplasmic adaptor subunit [Gemmatimonadaceae bacterium]
MLSLRTLGFAGTALLVIGGACSKQNAARGRPPVPVPVTRAHKADLPYTIDANGVVVPYQSAVVASQVEGIIQRVAFTEGSDVTQGQVLFQIDQRPYRAAYEQALANLARDRANAENARRESERYASLAQQDYVTKEQADQQRANAAATAAAMSATQAAVSNAKFNLDNTIIRAPISGRTGSVLVKAGNLVHASGTTPLVVINQVSPILVRFAIPSTQLPLLQRYGVTGTLGVTAIPNGGTGQVADSTPPLSLSIAPGDQGPSAQRGPPGASRPGRSGTSPSGATSTSSQLVAVVEPEHGILAFIDNAVDTTTGTVLLKASFPNPNKRLWVGEFVATQLRLFVEQNALVVPSSAVVPGQQGPYVYVLTDSSTAQQRLVTVERTVGAQSVIAAGLRDGEQVVTEGQSRLTPNAKVTIASPQGAPTGRGGASRTGGRGGRNGGRAAGAGASTGAGGTP